MKKLLSFFVLLVLTFSLLSCREGKGISIEVQYIRTNGRHNGIECVIIRSADELNAYYESAKENHNLERRENPASDYTIGFLDASDEYKEEFFSENALVLVLLEEPSGSIRHKVKGAERDGDKLIFDIEAIAPEFQSDDMAGWHIIIELDKDFVPDDVKNIIVNYIEN